MVAQCRSGEREEALEYECAGETSLIHAPSLAVSRCNIVRRQQQGAFQNEKLRKAKQGQARCTGSAPLGSARPDPAIKGKIICNLTQPDTPGMGVLSRTLLWYHIMLA